MKLFSFSWRQKLITTSLLCLFIPSVITLVLTGLYTKNELMNKASVKSEQSLEVADLYVSNIVKDMINAFNVIQYDSEMTTDLRVAWTRYENNGSKKIDFFSFKQISEKLDQLSFFGGETYVTVLLPDGLYFTNYSTFQNDMSFMYKEPWYEQMSGEPINTTNWIGVQDNYVRSSAARYPKLITIVRSFQLYANTPNAYVIISKPEEQFHEIFNKYAADQKMMLLDGNGMVLSQSDLSLIGSKLPASLYSPGKAQRKVWNGQEYIVENHPLSYAGWGMLSLTPYKEVTGKISNFISDSFVIQVLFFLVFSAAMFYLLRQFTKPIVQLAKTARKVEAGNLDVRSNVTGSDEIGHLSLSFNRMLERIEETIQQVKWEQDRKRMAELELLQAQINPHFLFNTLGSIRLQVLMKGEEEIAEIIGSLSTLLRMTINRNNEFMPLHEEVGIVESYMKLVNFRHHENVHFTARLASDTLLAEIPRFTLQPLIENAYIHGLKQKHGTIAFCSWKQDRSLYISVQDDGVGMTHEELESLRVMLKETGTRGEPSDGRQSRISGIGLKNVNERLSILYGDAYEMELDSSPGRGMMLTLHLPLSICGGEEEKQDAQRHTG